MIDISIIDLTAVPPELQMPGFPLLHFPSLQRLTLEILVLFGCVQNASIELVECDQQAWIDERSSASPRCGRTFEGLYKAARASKWRNLVDVRKQFPKADQTGKVLIFDIKGNRYRLITTVNYNQARVWVKDFLTHASTTERNG